MGVSLIPYFVSGGGFAGLMVLAFLTKSVVPGWMYREKVAELKETKQELAIQTARGDAGVLAAQVTKELVAGLRKGLDT
jgi:hypothetical protein